MYLSQIIHRILHPFNDDTEKIITAINRKIDNKSLILSEKIWPSYSRSFDELLKIIRKEMRVE